MKILLIGLGSMGSNHYRVLKLLVRNSRNLLIYDNDKLRLNKFLKKINNLEQEKNLDNLIKLADKVVIATSTSSHLKIILKCIKHNKKIIFVEKPLIKNLNEAKYLTNIVNKRKIKIFVGLIERFNSSVVSLNEFIINKKIYHFEATRTSKVNDRNQDIDVVSDLMIHDLDLALQFNGKIQSISSVGLLKGRSIEFAKVNIIHKNKSISTLTASRITDKKTRLLNFLCNDCFIEANLLKNEFQVYKNSKLNISNKKYKISNIIENVQSNPTEPLLAEMDYFINEFNFKIDKRKIDFGYNYNLKLLHYCNLISNQILKCGIKKN